MKDCFRTMLADLKHVIREDPSVVLMFTTPIAFVVAMSLITFAHVT